MSDAQGKNAVLLVMLRRAIDLCVETASDAETCDWEQNPAWFEVRDAADECTDIFREVDAKLNSTAQPPPQGHTRTG